MIELLKSKDMKKKYEMVKGKCIDCAFSNKENGSCMEVGNHKCFEFENQDKIWREVKDEDDE